MEALDKSGLTAFVAKLEAGIDPLAKPAANAETSPQKSLMEMARESREKRKAEKDAKRAQRKEKWNNFVGGVKDVMEMGRSKEIRLEIVDRVNLKVDSALDRAVKEMKDIGREMGEELNLMCNEAADAIEHGIDVVAKKSLEVGKQAAKDLARDVVAPVIEWAVVPTVKAMEAADKLVDDGRILKDEWSASRKESKADKIMRTVNSPNRTYLSQVAELTKDKNEKKGFLQRLVERYGNWIEGKRVDSIILSVEAENLRTEADNLREWHKNNKNKTSNDLTGAAQRLRTILKN